MGLHEIGKILYNKLYHHSSEDATTNWETIFPVTQKVTIQNKQTQKLNMKKANNPKLER